MYPPEFKTDPILFMEELSNIVDKVLSFDCYNRKCFKQVYIYGFFSGFTELQISMHLSEEFLLVSKYIGVLFFEKRRI